MNGCRVVIGVMVLFVLPPELPAQSSLRHIRRTDSQETAAVVVSGKSLLHVTQLLPHNARRELVAVGNPEAQIDQLLSDLESLLARFDTSVDQTVKLNVYVRDATVRDLFRTKLAAKWASHPQPALAFVASNLPLGASAAIDAIAASDQTSQAVIRTRAPTSTRHERLADVALLPKGDVVYVAGQAARDPSLGSATRNTLEGLARTLEHMGLKLTDVVQVKCFLQPMVESDVVEQEIIKFFADDLAPPVAYVEWVSSLPIEIELVAHAPRMATKETVSYSTPPWMTSSPVFSRVARIHGDQRIYVSDVLTDAAGDGGQQVKSVFGSLQGVLEQAGSSLKHLAKATYYVSSGDASEQLTNLRPLYYDPQRPPSASKAAVRSIGVPNRSFVLDMIAAPARH